MFCMALHQYINHQLCNGIRKCALQTVKHTMVRYKIVYRIFVSVFVVVLFWIGFVTLILTFYAISYENWLFYAIDYRLFFLSFSHYNEQLSSWVVTKQIHTVLINFSINLSVFGNSKVEWECFIWKEKWRILMYVYNVP